VISTYSRGHKLIWLFDKRKWVYADTGEDDNHYRPCKKCGKMPTKEGHDACLGTLKGVKYACCGHGIKGQKYIQYNGTVKNG